MFVAPDDAAAAGPITFGLCVDGEAVRRAPVSGLSQALPAGGGAGIGGPTSVPTKTGTRYSN